MPANAFDSRGGLAAAFALIGACLVLGGCATHRNSASVPVPLPSVPMDISDTSALVPEPSPAPQAVAFESGEASYYAKRFQGRRTASGERYDMHALTAAHRTLPFGSYARVSDRASARSVIVRINDRGPFARGRVIDLSYAAAALLGLQRKGSAQVTIERVSADAARQAPG
jgi:rare lipoprotein A